MLLSVGLILNNITQVNPKVEGPHASHLGSFIHSYMILHDNDLPLSTCAFTAVHSCALMHLIC